MKTFTLFSFICSLVFAYQVVNSLLPKDNVADLISRIELLDVNDVAKIQQMLAQPQINFKRDDNEKNDKQDKEKDDDKSMSEKVLAMPVVRFAIAFLAIVFINMVAITVHHIYMKLSSTGKSYRTIEHQLSPY